MLFTLQFFVVPIYVVCFPQMVYTVVVVVLLSSTGIVACRYKKIAIALIDRCKLLLLVPLIVTLCIALRIDVGSVRVFLFALFLLECPPCSP